MSEDADLKLTPGERARNLIEEYRANVDLWICEVKFRQERSQVFLGMNTVLLVVLGTLLTLGSDSILKSAIMACVAAAFGVLACVLSYRILLRTVVYSNRYERATGIRKSNCRAVGFGRDPVHADGFDRLGLVCPPKNDKGYRSGH